MKDAASRELESRTIRFGRRSLLSGAAVMAAAWAARGFADDGEPSEAAQASAPASRLPRFGPLSNQPDENGFLLPQGYSSKVIARSGDPVGESDVPFVSRPDGAGVIAHPEGGWWLLWNGEVGAGQGNVVSMRFGQSGELLDATIAAAGLNRPCSGGVTPWGTWLTCEEVPNGGVWEVSPTGASPPVLHGSMGRFAHEAAAVDGLRGVVYLSEDEPDGYFYRLVYGAGSLDNGVLQAAVVDAQGSVSWRTIPDPSGSWTPCRYQVAATVFHGGEGLAILDNRQVFLATKFDNVVWRFDIVSSRMDVQYQPSPSSVLSGVDNLAVTPGHDVLVCEDGGNMELVAVQQNGTAAALCRLVGQDGSELSGVCLSPDGRRVFVGSQRAISADEGIVYEIDGPFPW